MIVVISFFFKQKTAYEMRISDWSSDVCSSDLIAIVYRDMTFREIRLHTLSEGAIDHLHVGLKGTMNALFLKDLKLKIRRGMRGRIENGKSGGGIGYGYAVLKQFDANGEPIRGDKSEEHTSELQSLMRISNAVFLLQKKPSISTSQLLPKST